jgi:hypothetical protein
VLQQASGGLHFREMLDDIFSMTGNLEGPLMELRTIHRLHRVVEALKQGRVLGLEIYGTSIASPRNGFIVAMPWLDDI